MSIPQNMSPLAYSCFLLFLFVVFLFFFGFFCVFFRGGGSLFYLNIMKF